ncbi:hypothetical protein [Streptomyces antimycoticus]|uniref:hypothetical protein n=1 Tax=Streptomyces antimycoticus TaxID=68175 RepID=UPI00117C291C|nr:hypothetical protein [Streptomyces antimycoticus]
MTGDAERDFDPGGGCGGELVAAGDLTARRRSLGRHQLVELGLVVGLLPCGRGGTGRASGGAAQEFVQHPGCPGDTAHDAPLGTRDLRRLAHYFPLPRPVDLRTCRHDKGNLQVSPL